ncbi:MAG: 6-bladed beta-propeller [Nitrospiraceae bacterium]|nr:6-bladed beta-propeller [Nitrospiraceae bacterium]
MTPKLKLCGWKGWALVAAAFLTASCAPAYKARFDMTSSRGIVWPGKPEKPRVVYLWSLQDVAGEQGKGGLLAAAAGEEEVSDPQRSPVLLRPQGVYADEERLYVADPGAGRVTVVDRKTMDVMQILDTDTVSLSYPLSVVASQDGTIFVSDADLGKVIAYSPGGKFLRYFEGEIQRPAGLAIDRRRGIVYVVDTMGHTVYRYGTDGKRLGSIGRRGEGDGEFNYPTYAFADRKGQLYVTDFLNFRVQMFHPDGTFAGKLGLQGDSYDALDKPKGVAADSEGNIYIVDDGKDMVKIFDREGRLLLFFGGTGHGYGDFYLPTGIFIDDKNMIYVADTVNMRIQAFQLLGGNQ